MRPGAAIVLALLVVPTLAVTAPVVQNSPSNTLNLAQPLSAPIIHPPVRLPAPPAGTVFGELARSPHLSPSVAEAGVHLASGSTDPYARVGTVSCLCDQSTTFGLAYDSGKKELFVPEYFWNLVNVISATTNTFLTSVPVGSGPTGVAYDPATGEVFVTNSGSNNVSVISDATNHVVANVPVGNGPESAAYDPDQRTVWVVNRASGNASILSDSTNSIVATVATGLGPYSLAFDPVDHRMFVGNTIDYSIAVFWSSNDTPIKTLGFVGGGASSIAFDAGTDQLFVTNASYAQVVVLSGSTGSQVTEVFSMCGVGGRGPQSIAYDPGRGYLVFTNGVDGCLSVLSDSNDTIFQSVPDSAGPLAATYDPDSKEIYVLNGYSGVGIFALGTGYWAVFSQTGLPLGSVWNLSVDGVLKHLSGASASFALANGTHTFQVAAAGFRANPGSGAFTLLGAGTSVPIVFRELFSVTFAEQGLPTSAPWVLQFNGTAGYWSTTSTVSFNVVNGSYPFLVLPACGYVTGGGSGNVVVAGSNLTDNVSFARNASHDCSVTLTETGVPAGSPWTVVWNGTSITTNSTSLVLFEPVGRYNYTAVGTTWYPAKPPTSGFLTVVNSNTSAIVPFMSPALVHLIFRAVGLPSGSPTWGLSFGAPAHNYSTTTNRIDAEVPYGWINYTILPPAGYGVALVAGPPHPSQSSIYVTQASNLTILFGPMEYIDVLESSLPQYRLYPGAVWSILVTPKALTGGPLYPLALTTNSTAIAFYAPAGSALLLVVNPPGSEYRPIPARMSLHVPLHAVYRVVAFKLLTQTVLFKEVFLAGGQNWTVTIVNGTSPVFSYPFSLTQSAGAGAIRFRLPTGNYTFSVTNTGSQVPNLPMGTVTVESAPSPAQSVYIGFN